MTEDEMTETDLLAGQYVLGTLSREDAADVERSADKDRDLAAAIAFWTERLSALDALRPVHPVPASLWDRIERSASSPDETVVSFQSKARDRGQTVWKMATALAVAASVVLAVMVAQPSGGEISSASAYAVVLQAPDDRDVTWLVQTSGSDTLQLVPIGDVSSPGGLTFQFWTKAVGAARPVSLGLVPVSGRLVIDRDALPELGVGQLFEVTLEPAGGSPTGLPTGRILGVGQAVLTSDGASERNASSA